MYSMIPQYLDQYGLPGAISAGSPLNMGDACADYYTILATTDMSNILDTEGLFWSPENTPRRHPDTTQWWGQPHEFSRDQVLPVLCASIMRKNTVSSVFLSKLFWSHAKRLFLFAWNTRSSVFPCTAFNFPDVTGPEVFGLWLRIYQPFGYKLLLPFCDLETLVNAILWRLWPKDNISRNFMLVCAAQKRIPSIISRVSYKISNFPDLIRRWNDNTTVCGEYPTAPLIEAALK